MGRPVKWTINVHSIRERVTSSKLETWDREAVQNIFGVRRVTAQNLMRAIGELSNIGGAHLTTRASLLEFLDYVIAAENPDEAARVRLDTAASTPPQKRSFRLPVPREYRGVRLRDLPSSISIEPGVLTIRGPHAFAILEDLAILARALQNDVDAFVHAWNPSRQVKETDPDGVQAMFEELRRMEEAAVLKKSISQFAS